MWDFEERTNSACTVTEGGFDYIGGLQNSDTSQFACKLLCKTFPWCRGIRVSSSATSNGCRLLTDQTQNIRTGWPHFNAGNWAEPNQWKESPISSYKCFEKILVGKYIVFLIKHKSFFLILRLSFMKE